MTILRWVGTLLVGCAIAPPSATAQSLELTCLPPLHDDADGCRGTIAPADSIQGLSIAIRLTRGEVGLLDSAVIFRATSGHFASDTVLTDADGIARALWFRASGGSSAISVSTSGGRASKGVILTPRRSPTGTSLGFVRAGGNNQSWYERNQLPRPVAVRIFRISGRGPSGLPATDCSAQRIVFSLPAAAGTLTTRDTVRAELNGDEECVARTTWVLAAGPGERYLQATLVPGEGFSTKTTPTSFRATSRALPRLVSGISITDLRHEHRLESEDDSVFKVSRELADGSTLEYDSTKSGSSHTDWTTGGDHVSVFVGVSAALVPRWDFLTATVGVDLADPTNDWFVGLSALRIIDQFYQWFGAETRSTEGLPVDLHIMGNVGRVDVVTDPQGCAAGGDCETETRTRFRGWTGLITIDAGSLFADLVKALIS